MPLPRWLRRLLQPDTSLVRMVSDIERAIPPRGSGLYTPPTDEQVVTFRSLFLAVARGRVDEAERLAYEVGYEIPPLPDGEGGRGLLLVTETRPWRSRFGFFAIDPGADVADVVIEVPHPRHDMHTGRIGACLFSQSAVHPFAFAMATAHRYDSGTRHHPPTPADPARYAPSVFQIAHEVFTTEGRARHTVQLHGYAYARARHGEFSAVPVDAVLSHGARPDGSLVSASPGGAATLFAEALRRAGITAAVADADGLWQPLCASRNVQGHFTNSAEGAGPGWFIHVELERDLRERAVGGSPGVLDGLRRAFDEVPWHQGRGG